MTKPNDNDQTVSDEKDWLNELVRLMARLRDKDGGPWDQEQTHESLKRCLVEETAEFLDAVDERNDEAMQEELGDILLNVVFHAQIAAEENRFDLQSIARKICEKLIRRHPHVFGDKKVTHPDSVKVMWEQIKQAERRDKSDKPQSALDGVPKHLSALHRAYKIQKKASRVGFDWPTADGVVEKIEEELAEVRHAMEQDNPETVIQEIGDLLFAVTNLSRFYHHIPEEALHRTIRKFERRFHYIEQRLRDQGKRPEQCELDELDTLWNDAKQEGI